MAENSHIEWTHHTWNPWTGCTKVSEGCTYCYMYREKERYRPAGEKYEALTDHQRAYYDPKIVLRSKGNFKKPLSWHKGLTGQEPLTERLVFTCSYSDFFHEKADEWRAEAWQVIRDTPNLTYQILTKRPERVLGCLPPDWAGGYPNVWLGTTVENQKAALRLPLLKTWPAVVRFVSFEPLLGPICFSDVKEIWAWTPANAPTDPWYNFPFEWAIIGGESGNNTGKYRYRECKTHWLIDLADDLREGNVPTFMKQLGTNLATEYGLKDRHGRDWAEWPNRLRVRQFPLGMDAVTPPIVQPDLFNS